MTLEEMEKMDIRDLNPDDLVDIRNVHIDRSLPKEERIKSMIEQMKNPYAFKYGDVVVKMEFAHNGRTLEDCMERYLRGM